MNGGGGDAHEAALMQQQHVQAALVHHQQQGMAATSFAASSSKPMLPPPTPSQPTTFQSADACIMDVDPAAPGRLPPRNKQVVAHRRSRSEVPFGYLSQPSVVEAGGWGGGHGDADDLFNAYLNLEGLDVELNNNNSSDDRHDDGDSRGSSMKTTNGADDSSENESGDQGAAADRLREVVGVNKLKRGAAGEPAPAVARHARSLSMDSLIGKSSNFSAGGGTSAAAANGIMLPGQQNRFSVEFGSVEFTPAEMKRIMADDKLAEMALEDPKRVKKVLANRRSAARSKERKLHYIAQLEHKVQVLHTQATTLSAQLTLLQRDSAVVATQNNELKFRLEALEQQAQLRDALNEALTTEVQRLKVAAAELEGSCSFSNNQVQHQQIHINIQQDHQQQQQATLVQLYQQQQPQHSEAAKNNDSKE